MIFMIVSASTPKSARFVTAQWQRSWNTKSSIFCSSHKPVPFYGGMIQLLSILVKTYPLDMCHPIFFSYALQFQPQGWRDRDKPLLSGLSDVPRGKGTSFLQVHTVPRQGENFLQSHSRVIPRKKHRLKL